MPKYDAWGIAPAGKGPDALMSDNGSNRLAAIESALTAVQVALGEIGSAVQHQAEITARGFETLTDMVRVLDARLSAPDARMSVLDARMAEIATELRTHSHKGAD